MNGGGSGMLSCFHKLRTVSEIDLTRPITSWLRVFSIYYLFRMYSSTCSGCWHSSRSLSKRSPVYSSLGYSASSLLLSNPYLSSVAIFRSTNYMCCCLSCWRCSIAWSMTEFITLTLLDSLGLLTASFNNSVVRSFRVILWCIRCWLLQEHSSMSHRKGRE